MCSSDLWNTLTNGTGTSYTNSQSVTINGALNLFAQWSANSYQVSFNTQGGPDVAGQSWTTATTLTLPAAPTRTGYTFNGWYDAASGGTRVGTGGGVSNGLNFDGSNDRITIPHSSSFNATSAFTVEAWIKTSYSGTYKYITTKGEDSFYLAVNTGKAAIYLKNVGGWLQSSVNVNDDQWHHIAGTYNGSAMKIYVDGIEIGRAHV